MAPKSEIHQFTATKADSTEIKEAAARVGLPVATWLRMVALAAARRVPE